MHEAICCRKAESVAQAEHHTKLGQAFAGAAPTAAITCSAQQPCCQLWEAVRQALLQQQLGSGSLLAQAQGQLQDLQQPIQVRLPQGALLQALAAPHRL